MKWRCSWLVHIPKPPACSPRTISSHSTPSTPSLATSATSLPATSLHWGREDTVGLATVQCIQHSQATPTVCISSTSSHKTCTEIAPYYLVPEVQHFWQDPFLRSALEGLGIRIICDLSWCPMNRFRKYPQTDTVVAHPIISAYLANYWRQETSNIAYQSQHVSGWVLPQSSTIVHGTPAQVAG